MLDAEHKHLFLRMTPAQRDSLRRICHGSVPATVQIGESLRKLGLVTRNTEYIVKRVYADKDGEHLQFEKKNPIKSHEWDATDLGFNFDNVRIQFNAL